MSNINSFNQGLLDFIQSSPTPFHAVASMAKRLDQNGFQRLDGGKPWDMQPGGRYYQLRNGSSIIAFVYGKSDLAQSGLRMIGAHTDSPCLRVKPNPDLKQKGYFQLGVEVYGGALLNPWFDRDLSLAGRVTFTNKDGKLQSALIDFNKPIAVIPSLAIHLDRDANKNRKVNAQTDIPPILKLMETDESISFVDIIKSRLLEENTSLSLDDFSLEQTLDYELSFYDTQAPAIVGLKDEFIASARLDNLASCYVGLEALIAACAGTGTDNKELEASSLLVCNDHEEVGSQSACGALGPMLRDFLGRLQADNHCRAAMLENSMLISADNAHGIHPNYTAKHDSNHGPILNGGPVIKTNANQRYATNSLTSALFKQACSKAKVPVQTFVSRTDMGCGSTIGPLTAGEIGVNTLDVGIPTFAMHSVRELAGTEDAYHLFQALLQFQAMDQLYL